MSMASFDSALSMLGTIIFLRSVMSSLGHFFSVGWGICISSAALFLTVLYLKYGRRYKHSKAYETQHIYVPLKMWLAATHIAILLEHTLQYIFFLHMRIISWVKTEIGYSSKTSLLSLNLLAHLGVGVEWGRNMTQCHLRGEIHWCAAKGGEDGKEAKQQKTHANAKTSLHQILPFFCLRIHYTY